MVACHAMSMPLTPLGLDVSSWLHMGGYFVSLSLLSVGGALATAPDLYRTAVTQQGWLSSQQFADSIAIAQAAPGPNIMYVALLGWNIGMNAMANSSSWAAWSVAFACCIACMSCMLLPSSVLALASARWLREHHALRSVRTFRWGMMPLVVGMVLATGWILAARDTGTDHPWMAWLLTAVAAVLVWKTRLHLLWMLVVGALCGALGWI
jgi:chromate transporter